MKTPIENLLCNIALVRHKWRSIPARNWGRTLAIFPCAAFLAAGTITAQAGPAVTNGDFETGAAAPWLNGTSAAPAPTAAAAHSGEYGLEATGGFVLIRQNIQNQIIAGPVYHFTAWINLLEVSPMPNLPPFYTPHFRVFTTNGSEVSVDAINATGLGWQKLEFSKSFTAQELQGAVTLEIGGMLGKIQIDDVSGELLANGSFDTADGAGWSYEPSGIWAPFAVPGEVDLHRSYTGSPVKMLWQNLAINNVGGATGTASMRIKSTSNWPTPGTISTKVYLDFLDSSGNPQRTLLLAPDNSTVNSPPDGTLFSANFTLPANAQQVTGFSVDRSGPGLFQAMDFHLNLVTNPYEAWRIMKFSTDDIAAGNTGMAADFEGDGNVNLLEYAFHTEPKTGDIAPIAGRVSANQMEISFPCHSGRTDITYIVQASPNLAAGSWTDIAQSTGGATTTPINGSGCTIYDTGSGLRTVTVVEANASPGVRFLRIKVVSP